MTRTRRSSGSHPPTASPTQETAARTILRDFMAQHGRAIAQHQPLEGRQAVDALVALFRRAHALLGRETPPSLPRTVASDRPRRMGCGGCGETLYTIYHLAGERRAPLRLLCECQGCYHTSIISISASLDIAFGEDSDGRLSVSPE